METNKVAIDRPVGETSAQLMELEEVLGSLEANISSLVDDLMPVMTAECDESRSKNKDDAPARGLHTELGHAAQVVLLRVIAINDNVASLREKLSI